MTTANKEFQILLSTYNGERYLREQLDSFTRLSNFDAVKVLIRDDGSTDSTPEILREYAEKFGFEIHYGENVGLNASLHTLLGLRDRECKYFAFSDQDDVWLEDKLTHAKEALSAADQSIPYLYSATSHLTDEKLNIKGTTFIPKRKLSFYNAMVQNVCIGHTEVMNATLAALLEREYTDDIMVTDYWTYLLASATGEIIYDKTPTTLYRQHGRNVIGYESSRIRALKVRVNRVKTKISVKNARQLRAFITLYKDVIPKDYVFEAERFFNCQRSFFSRLSYVFKSKAYRQTKIETLIFRLMYLFGRYNVAN